MSDDFVRKDACGRKKKYDSLKKAKFAVSRLRRHKHERGLHVYVCPYCHYFHVGHALSKESLLAKKK